MPVKHGPEGFKGEITVDKACLWPGCRRWPMEGRVMCCDHEETDEYRMPTKEVDDKEWTGEE